MKNGLGKQVKGRKETMAVLVRLSEKATAKQERKDADHGFVIISDVSVGSCACVMLMRMDWKMRKESFTSGFQRRSSPSMMALGTRSWA